MQRIKATNTIKTQLKAETSNEIKGFCKISSIDASMSPGPHCKLETEINGKYDATTRQTTVPIKQNGRRSKKHCAFKVCACECESDQELPAHIHDVHLNSLQPVLDLFGKGMVRVQSMNSFG